MLVGGVSVVAWMLASFVQKIKDGFILSQQLAAPSIVSPENTIAKNHVIAMRAKQDKERIDRLRHKRQHDSKPSNSTTDLPIGLGHITEDITGELFPEAQCVIARKPLTNETEYLVAWLPGSGQRLRARFVWSRFKSLAQRMALSQATILVPMLPGGSRELFILTEEDSNETTIHNGNRVRRDTRRMRPAKSRSYANAASA